MQIIRRECNPCLKITDRVIPRVKDNPWILVTLLRLDAIHYKERDRGRVVLRAVHNVLEINNEGHRDLIGMYVSESEGAKFWLLVLTDLKSRGVMDILIACTDNLADFSEDILSIFPLSEVQSCIIHQIRNSLKSKDKNRYFGVIGFFVTFRESLSGLRQNHLSS